MTHADTDWARLDSWLFSSRRPRRLSRRTIRSRSSSPKRPVKVEGTLTRLSWRNPHTLFLLQGKPVDSTEAEQEWTIEGPSPQQITKIGWGANVSKPGDKVTFNGRPRRDGKPELLLLSVTLADGKSYNFSPD